jgi:hypothetical protein
MPTPTPTIDPRVLATHIALFDLWFPLADLPIPPDVKVQVAPIADQVRAGMLQEFEESESLMGLLTGMTDPKLLPFYDCLAGSADPAAKAFLAARGGFGGMAAELRSPLFSFLFEGSCGPASTRVAMVLREAYLSGVWDLPLGVPLTGNLPPPVFMPDMEIYSALHKPKLRRRGFTMTPTKKASDTAMARSIASWLAAAPGALPSPTNCGKPANASSWSKRVRGWSGARWIPEAIPN